MQDYQFLPDWVEGFIAIPVLSIFFAGFVGFVSALNAVTDSILQIWLRFKGVLLSRARKNASRLVIFPSPEEIAKYSIKSVGKYDDDDRVEYLEYLSGLNVLKRKMAELRYQKSSRRVFIMMLSFVYIFIYISIRYVYVAMN